MENQNIGNDCTKCEDERNLEEDVLDSPPKIVEQTGQEDDSSDHMETANHLKTD